MKAWVYTIRKIGSQKSNLGDLYFDSHNQFPDLTDSQIVQSGFLIILNESELSSVFEELSAKLKKDSNLLLFAKENKKFPQGCDFAEIVLPMEKPEYFRFYFSKTNPRNRLIFTNVNLDSLDFLEAKTNGVLHEISQRIAPAVYRYIDSYIERFNPQTNSKQKVIKLNRELTQFVSSWELFHQESGVKDFHNSSLAQSQKKRIQSYKTALNHLSAIPEELSVLKKLWKWFLSNPLNTFVNKVVVAILFALVLLLVAQFSG